jgi:transcription termination factor NusG
MSGFESQDDDGCSWRLLFTKPQAEAWVEANLRKQGFDTLLPRTPKRMGLAPLFPRYVFAGYRPGQRGESFAGTYGVQYVVHCGERPAHVPASVIREIRSRMDERGIVRVEDVSGVDSIFAKRQRERLDALAKFAAAGFKVRIA